MKSDARSSTTFDEPTTAGRSLRVDQKRQRRGERDAEPHHRRQLEPRQQRERGHAGDAAQQVDRVGLKRRPRGQLAAHALGDGEEEQRDDDEEERQQHRALDGHDRCRRSAREVDVRRAGRDRHFEPQPVDGDDDDQLREWKPRDERSAPVGEQAAEPAAEEGRQQDEVGEVRQEPDVRRHPPNERDLEEEDQERRQEQRHSW